MNTDDMHKFDQLMKNYYRNKCQKLDGVNSLLWGVAIDLVRAIAESELDGSGINSLKEVGEQKAGDLRLLLERGEAP